MKILITGGSGLLGRYLTKELKNKHDLLALFRNNGSSIEGVKKQSVDINDFEAFNRAAEKFSPDVIIHNAAVANPAEADRLDPALVYRTNVSASENIAKFCRDRCRMIYISSDLVYAGYRGKMLEESAKLAPVSLYAETKLMGEVKISQSLHDHIILRCALMYGIGKDHEVNHFQYMYDNFSSGKRTRLFGDQFRTPLAIFDAVRMIGEIAEKEIKAGTYNFGGPDRLSRAEMGRILCEEAGFDSSLVIENSLDDVEGIYKVADVSMDISKLTSEEIMPLPYRRCVSEIIKSGRSL